MGVEAVDEDEMDVLRSVVTPTYSCMQGGIHTGNQEREVHTYTGCLQGRVVPFIKEQLCGLVHIYPLL